MLQNIILAILLSDKTIHGVCSFTLRFFYYEPSHLRHKLIKSFVFILFHILCYAYLAITLNIVATQQTAAEAGLAFQKLKERKILT